MVVTCLFLLFYFFFFIFFLLSFPACFDCFPLWLDVFRLTKWWSGWIHNSVLFLPLPKMKQLYCDSATFDRTDSTDLPSTVWMHLLHSYVSDVDIFPNFSFWRVLSLFMLGILQSRDLFFFFLSCLCRCTQILTVQSMYLLPYFYPTRKWVEIIVVCKYSDRISTPYS